MKAYRADIQVVDGQWATISLDEPKQSQRQRALAGTRSTHNAHLLPWLDDGVDTMQYQWKTLSIAKLVITEGQATFSGPVPSGRLLSIIHAA